MAAPKPAPSTVPSTAPPSALVFAFSTAPPIWFDAYSLHTASSSAKTLNGLFGAGMTCTVGPIGCVAHALSSATEVSAAIAAFFLITKFSPSMSRRRCRRHRTPRGVALGYIGIIALRIVAVIPILRGARRGTGRRRRGIGGLHIDWRRRIDDRGRWIVIVGRRVIPGNADADADEDARLR